MKVVHVVSTFPPYHGGMGRVAYLQAAGLAHLGVEVRVIVPAFPGRVQKQFPFPVVQVKPRLRFGNAALMPALDEYFVGADIVHWHYPFYGATEAMLHFKRHHPQTPLVLTYHMDTVGFGLRKIIFAWHRERYLGKILRAVQAVHVASRDYADVSYLSPHLFDLGNKLHEIPFGIDTEHFAPEGEVATLRRTFGISDEEAVALFVGGLDHAHYFKGFDVLLRALHGAIASGASLHLVVVGEGKLRAQYEALAERLGILEKVHFLGTEPDENLPNLYRAADFLVLPSRDKSEAFGLVLLEAMATARPVIASDLPGVRTVFREGEEGLHVPPGNATALAATMIRLSADSHLRGEMGERARRRVVERYEYKASAERLVELYKQVLK